MHCILNESLGFNVNVAANASLRRFANVTKPFGITPEQYVTMMMLKENPGITQTQMAEKIFKDKTTITRGVDGLVDKGYVTKERDSTDRRAFNVTLTAEGQRVIEEVDAIVGPIIAKQKAMYSKEELAIFFRILTDLRDFDIESLAGH